MLSNDVLLKEQLRKYYVEFDTAMGKRTGYFRQVEKYKGRNQETFNWEHLTFAKSQL